MISAIFSGSSAPTAAFLEQRRRERSPRTPLLLIAKNGVEVETRGIRRRFCSRVRDPALKIQMLSDVHRCRRGEAGAGHDAQQLDGVDSGRPRLDFAGRAHVDDLSNLVVLGNFLKKQTRHRLVEDAAARPFEADLAATDASQDRLKRPVTFRFEALDFVMTINTKRRPNRPS